MEKKRLIQHHLCFLKQNRGVHKSFKNVEVIVSKRKEFNISFVLDKIFDLKMESDFLYIPDESNIFPKPTYFLVNNITYMTASFEVVKKWSENPSIQVKKVERLDELEAFSEVQVRGFNESEEAYLDWFPWLQEMNIQGFGFENQHYFVAYLDEVPVGVCLIVEDEEIYGLYAIATNPKYRKQGVATTIMKKSIERCQPKNNTVLALQVLSGSRAEHLYRKLGFKKECSFNMYLRK